MRKLVLVLIVATLLATSCKNESSTGTGGDTAAITDTSATSTSSTATTNSAASATTATTDATKTDTAATKRLKHELVLARDAALESAQLKSQFLARATRSARR